MLSFLSRDVCATHAHWPVSTHARADRRVVARTPCSSVAMATGEAIFLCTVGGCWSFDAGGGGQVSWRMFAQIRCFFLDFFDGASSEIE